MRREGVFSLPRVAGAWLLLLPGVVAFRSEEHTSELQSQY